MAETPATLLYAVQTDPNPLRVGRTNARVTLVVSNPTGDYVSVTSIVFDLGEGLTATALTNDPGSIHWPSNAGWTIDRSGAQFTLTPDNSASGTLRPGQIGDEGLAFDFSNILVNAQVGTVDLLITENVGGPTAGTATIRVSKFPQEFEVGNLTATPSEVDPGGSTTLSWDGSGDATYGLSYLATKVPGVKSPHAVQNLLQTTTFTLHCTSSQDGQPIAVDLQTAVQVTTPEVVSFQKAFDIVYLGQENRLEWQTTMTHYCVLKADGITREPNAPPNSVPGGYPFIAASNRTTFELVPVRKGIEQRSSATCEVFAKTLRLRKALPGRPGWATVAVDVQGHQAFLCNVHTNAVDVMSLEDVPASEAKPAVPAGSVVASIPVGMGPRGIALSYDGTLVYVANGDSHSLSVIDVATMTNVGTIEKVPNPYGIALIGNTAYVTNFGANTISVVDLAKKSVAGTLPGGGNRPTGVAVTPDGKTLFVASYADGTVNVFDLASGKGSGVPVGAHPTGAAVSVRNASASSVYVTGHMASEIVVLDARFGKYTARAPAGMRPWGLGVSIDGATTLVVGDLGVFVFEFGLSARPAAVR